MFIALYSLLFSCLVTKQFWVEEGYKSNNEGEERRDAVSTVSRGEFPHTAIALSRRTAGE